MASYNGTIVLSGMISPTDTLDTYPTHEDILGKGGFQTVADIATRDGISDLRRKLGMMVYVVATETAYVLQGVLDNTGWVIFSAGSSTPFPPDTSETFLLIYTDYKNASEADYTYNVKKDIIKIDVTDGTNIFYVVDLTYAQNGDIINKVITDSLGNYVTITYTYTQGLITSKENIYTSI